MLIGSEIADFRGWPQVEAIPRIPVRPGPTTVKAALRSVGVSCLVLFVHLLGWGGCGPASLRAEEAWSSLWAANSDEFFRRWQVTSYGGDGAVGFADGCLTMDAGVALTGVHWRGELPFPRVGYELRCQARRTQGSDFFCGLTFPYGQGAATYVLGGWGGSLVGLSCLDGHDASDNETTHFHQFKQNQWYDVRIRVREGFIDAWIDEARVMAVPVRDREVSVRGDVAASQPLGLTTFQSRGQVKDLAYRRLDRK